MDTAKLSYLGFGKHTRFMKHAFILKDLQFDAGFCLAGSWGQFFFFENDASNAERYRKRIWSSFDSNWKIWTVTVEIITLLVDKFSKHFSQILRFNFMKLFYDYISNRKFCHLTDILFIFNRIIFSLTSKNIYFIYMTKTDVFFLN